MLTYIINIPQNDNVFLERFAFRLRKKSHFYIIFGRIMQKKAYKWPFYAEIRQNKIKILLIKYK